MQVSHGALDREFINNIPESVMALDKDVDGWSLSSSYGLFRRYYFACTVHVITTGKLSIASGHVVMVGHLFSE